MRDKRFFWTKANGLKADIARHTEKERDLRKKLEEATMNDDEVSIRVYRHFLNLLLDSKAEITSQIGKK